MNTGWFVTANDIRTWTDTNKRRAEEFLPNLVLKLIYASCKPTQLHFPSGDSVAIGGWDGTLTVDEGNEFVPSAFSVWEFGTNKSINTKFETDYQKRTDNPNEIDTSETTFVFVTSKTWKDKDEKCSEKNAENIWKQVRGINADDLETWLHKCPAVHRMFSRIIGKRTEAIIDINQAWESWICSTSIPATIELVLNGRVSQSENLLRKLSVSPTIISIKASSGNEAYAFVLATLKNNENLSSKVLIVKDQVSWDFLLDSGNTLILIPKDFTPENVGYAKQKGHFVVIPVDFNSPSSISHEIKLEQMPRLDRINALQTMGLSKENAEQIYADTHGYLEPIRRHELLGSNEFSIPDWVDNFDSNILFAILMATKWDNQKDKDKNAISRLANVPYDQLEEKLFELSSFGDSPIHLVGNIWQTVSKFDFWSLFAHKINRQNIERLENVVLDILSELNPAYELAPDERWLANIKGAVPEYSSYLKSGLSDSLTLIAAFGDEKCQSMGEIKLSNQVDYWVRELLTKDISARGWYSFGSDLVLLAEASPVSFLQALESSMEGNEPAIASLFFDESLYACPHANLLWALETISWDLRYLPHVSNALAKLSELDSGGRHTNRPLNSLKEIFMGWVNNTCATHEQRLQIIDYSLIRFYPEIAWKLLISLLPETHDGFSTPINKPIYRDWAKNIDYEVTKQEYYLYIESLADRLLNLAGNKLGPRWIELVENITRLPKRIFYEAIEKLLVIEFDEMDDTMRLDVANSLRETVSKHREFNDKKWSLPKEAVDKLAEAFNVIIPENPIFKNKYLFDSYYPNFINPTIISEENNQTDEEIIEVYRQKALFEIYQKFGIDGIKRLINDCYHPNLIGNSIASPELRDKLESELLDWLGNTDVKLISASHSFIFKCAHVNYDWILTVFEQFERWDKSKIISFLLGFPFDANILEFLNNADEEIGKMYWKKVKHYFLSDAHLELINLVLEQLTISDRPLAAIDAASQILYDANCKVSLNSSLLGDILKKIATNPTNDEHLQISDVRNGILKAIEYIQEQEQLSREEIIQIEWVYLRVFRFDSFKAIYLEEEIVTNPIFFIQIVSFIYKKDESEREVETTSDNNEKLRAENAYSLLDSISTIPGLQENGLIDAEKLREWIFNSRDQFERLGRVKIGDDQIGKVISKSPLGTDGIWPHEIVRDLIEEIQSPELENALEVGKYNLREARMSLPYDGGKEERTLASEYFKETQEIMLKWPRTSEILRRLGKSYEDDAEREDREVELLG